MSGIDRITRVEKKRQKPQQGRFKKKKRFQLIDIRETMKKVAEFD